MLGLTVYSWLATILCAAWFARRLAAARGGDLGLAASLLWQGGIYTAWLPACVAVWLMLRRFGAGAVGHLALYLAAALIVPLEALVSALIDAAFASGPTIAVRTLTRMPVSLLIYTAIVAVALAAVHHRQAGDERARARLLEIALEEARNALARLTADALSHERLIVMSGARRVPVDIAEVEWFGAADNYVVVHWSDREGLLRSTLQALEERLDPRLFARCHRSTLVNLARVRAFAPLSDGSWRLTMESGAEVVTSRTYRARLLERLGL